MNTQKPQDEPSTTSAKPEDSGKASISRETKLVRYLHYGRGNIGRITFNVNELEMQYRYGRPGVEITIEMPDRTTAHAFLQFEDFGQAFHFVLRNQPSS